MMEGGGKDDVLNGVDGWQTKTITGRYPTGNGSKAPPEHGRGSNKPNEAPLLMLCSRSSVGSDGGKGGLWIEFHPLLWDFLSAVFPGAHQSSANSILISSDCPLPLLLR